MKTFNFEKVNPSHPDKVADRVAGAILDYTRTKNEYFISAVEVLIGHNKCTIINETNTPIEEEKVKNIVSRILGFDIEVEYKEVKQDEHLAKNQEREIKAGDNGIFSGQPTNKYEQFLTNLAAEIYKKYNSDGKYIIHIDDISNYKSNRYNMLLIICQSNANREELYNFVSLYVYENVDENVYTTEIIVNPLGDWTGGINVDTGATNRKLGSDMGRAVTGGGLHGKDLSKADLTVNTWMNIWAKELNSEVTGFCRIGQDYIKVENEHFTYKKDYSLMYDKVKEYIDEVGGYEKFAEWGLIRPNEEKELLM